MKKTTSTCTRSTRLDDSEPGNDLNYLQKCVQLQGLENNNVCLFWNRLAIGLEEARDSIVFDYSVSAHAMMCR
jgi:hypothetical protein